MKQRELFEILREDELTEPKSQTISSGEST